MLENTARQPRAMVFVNGIRVAWYDIEVNTNAYYQSDSFHVILPAVKNQPKEITRQWWALQNPIEIEIYAGFPSDVDNYTKADLDLLIIGNVDEIPHELTADTITLSGRDYSALMVDTKIVVDDHLNRTSSKVASALAIKYSLGTKYITDTSTKIGRIYELSYTKLNRQTTEWSFLCFLAQEEGFQVFVRGHDLHFEPKLTDAPQYIIEWKDEDSDGLKKFRGEKLTCIRNLTLAKDIIVHVRVINMKTGKPFTVKVQATHMRDTTLNKGKRFIGAPQVYFEHIRAHMDKAGALKYAQALLKNISRHQVKLDITGIPADNILTPSHLIKLIGTGSYDQMYHPDSIIRKMNLEDGYKMDIIAKNHDVNSVVPV